MKVLIFGAAGQLGRSLCAEYAERAQVTEVDLTGVPVRCDITDASRVRTLMNEVRPTLVFHLAAMHDLPDCEARPEAAFAVNAIATRHIAEACADLHARLVFISTDYVFDGAKGKPYTEADPPKPLNTYGISKAAGEMAAPAYCADCLVVRTAALYGLTPCHGKKGRNFITLMESLAAEQKEIRVVTDEITTPTYVAPLARQLRLLAEKGEPGIYHATCQGQCSWYEFAVAVFAALGQNVKVTPTTSAERQSPLRRPAYSVLENAHLRSVGLDVMPHWREALDQYFADRSRMLHNA